MCGIHSRDECRTRRSTDTHCPVKAGIAYALCRRASIVGVTATLSPKQCSQGPMSSHTTQTMFGLTASPSSVVETGIPPALTSCDTVQAAQTALPYKKECIICFITVHFIQSVRLSKKDTLRNTIFIECLDGKIIFLSHREGT